MSDSLQRRGRTPPPDEETAARVEKWISRCTFMSDGARCDGFWLLLLLSVWISDFIQVEFLVYDEHLS